jgi:Na+/proline symporter
MSSAATSSLTFAPVAQQVARRVGLRRWLGWLSRTLWLAVAGIIVLVALAVLTGQTLFSSLAWMAFVAWLLIPLGLILWRKPGHYSIALPDVVKPLPARGGLSNKVS